MIDLNKYEVVPSVVYERDDGKRASIFGAIPWTSNAEKARWSTVTVGYTVRNPRTGQVGVGRVPCATYIEAQALADKLGRPSAIGYGD